MLDGELLITKGDTILCHELSKEVQAFYRDGLPAQFMIGSVSKIFTAVALLKALYDTSHGNNEDEIIAIVKAKLHTPVIHFLPPERFAWGSPIPTWAHKVTLHHLLSHTSGIVQHIHILFETEGYDAVQDFLREAHGPEYIVQKWGNVPLAFEPGTDYSYSNLGYNLLAKVISILTNMPFEDYLNTRIFIPNQLDSTRCAKQGTSCYLKSLEEYRNLVPEKVYLAPTASAYSPDAETLLDISFAQGSGSIISTAQDLARWKILLHQNQTILPPALYDLLIKPHKNNHGYGIFNRKGIFNYTGKIGSYVSFSCFIPKYTISIIMLFHTDHDESAFMQERAKLEAQYFTIFPDGKERSEYIAKLAEEKYPPIRGAAVLLKTIFEELQTIGEAPDETE